MTNTRIDHAPKRHPLITALGLSLGAAVALGLARFSYGLLLSPMRNDLGWSYLLAGSMNTGNALGYFIGALVTPLVLRRFTARELLIRGALLTSALMVGGGFFTDTTALMIQRVLTGVTSACVFICGGVLASRLATRHPDRSGLLLGLYYSGPGLGIAISALLVPAALGVAAAEGAAHVWQWAWWGLGAICFVATVALVLPSRGLPEPVRASVGAARFRVRDFGFGLASYCMFGLGYIGYMTFVVALLKQQGMRPDAITAFYALLGIAVVASSRIWARMLDRFRGGESLAILNALVGVACVLPTLTSAVPVVFGSGMLFGAVFSSVVTSTTALVRHNLPASSWPAGIAAFTTVFALGQIVGPSVVGWIADGSGGLESGLVFSAVALFVGALFALGQRPLATTARIVGQQTSTGSTATAAAS
jgi:predicted MFS family arabinose efflux permease